jgi:hypothetical protein
MHLARFLGKLLADIIGVLRNSRSCGDIIATGEAVSAAGSGEEGGAGGGSPRFAPTTPGAIIDFSTLAELQTGQVIRAALTCVS